MPSGGARGAAAEGEHQQRCGPSSRPRDFGRSPAPQTGHRGRHPRKGAKSTLGSGRLKKPPSQLPHPVGCLRCGRRSVVPRGARPEPRDHRHPDRARRGRPLRAVRHACPRPARRWQVRAGRRRPDVGSRRRIRLFRPVRRTRLSPVARRSTPPTTRSARSLASFAGLGVVVVASQLLPGRRSTSWRSRLGYAAGVIAKDLLLALFLVPRVRGSGSVHRLDDDRRDDRDVQAVPRPGSAPRVVST